MLGSVLLNFTKHWPKVFSTISPDVFSLETHQTIYRRMEDIAERGEHIDRITLSNELMTRNELDLIGGLSYLVSLDDGLPEHPSIDSYINIVLEKATLRRIILLGQHAANAAILEQEPSAKILESIGKRVAQMQVDSGVRSPFETPGEFLGGYKGGVDGFLQNAIRMGVPSGFPQLDEAILGFQPGGHYVLAGRPGQGKSAMAGNIAVSMAKQGKKVAFFSMEMPKELLLLRMACCEANVPLKAVIKGDLMPGQRTGLLNGADAIMQLPLFIDDNPHTTASQLYTRIERAKNEHNIDGFITDYIQIVDWQGDKELRFRNAYEGVSYISRILRTQARRLGIFSIGLSQLSRPPEKKRGVERPTLNDLRDSGALEQDAWSVVFVHRPEQYQPGNTELRGKAELVIAKGRLGGEGVINIRFISKYTKFVDDGPDLPPAQDD